MTAPNFYELDGAKLLADLVATYETLTGRKLQPAQAEYLVLQAVAAAQLRTHFQLQAATLNMFLPFSTAPALDYLAALVGVTRLQASGAGVTLSFTLEPTHTGIIIPSGTRVRSADGKVIFSTIAPKSVAAGVTPVTVLAQATTPGKAGNGYVVGAVNVLVDPLPFVISVTNTDTSKNGADVETDHELRERTQQAPARFSTAGPRAAYEYWAKTANPAIIDVAAIQITPGTVGVYPLVAGGVASPTVLAQVETAVNAEDVRPLTDTVVVANPTVINYNVVMDVQIIAGSDSQAIEAAIISNIRAIGDRAAQKLGENVTTLQCDTQAMIVPGVYYAETDLNPLPDDVETPANGVGIMGTITIYITEITPP
jgi:phage-related baseplate assembly protein